jgi:hypothetical protein
LEREQDQLSLGKVLPAQKADINQAFAVALLALDTLFVDPLDKRLMSLLSATQVI